jgi:hypothetical protein
MEALRKSLDQVSGSKKKLAKVPEKVSAKNGAKKRKAS